MADLSPSMLNQVLEATLAFMIFLLLLSVTAIVRVDPMAPASTEANTDTDIGAPFPGTMVAGPPPGQMAGAAPAPALWPPAAPNGMRPPTPARRSGLLGRTRYEARHVRGRMPKPRPPAPAGPPWGPAAPPPGRQQQSSERWT
ncbi:MAG TPA: hypothetical protein VHJ18_17515 [Streptosporangiaceae bacterium]|nr:hypothetical protein [Streptosporangiaceae bacterium]